MAFLTYGFVNVYGQIDLIIRKEEICNLYLFVSFKGLWYCWPCGFVTKVASLWNQGNALKWHTRYLSNRSQYATGVVSTIKGISCGVPDGSILEPLLFLCIFADHINFFRSDSDIKTMDSNINHELTQMSLETPYNGSFPI